MSSRTVYVVSFEPGEHGGTGGFQWYESQDTAREFYNEGPAQVGSEGDTWKMWKHDTSEGDTEEVTEEIDALWLISWPPDPRQLIASKTID